MKEVTFTVRNALRAALAAAASINLNHVLLESVSHHAAQPKSPADSADFAGREKLHACPCAADSAVAVDTEASLQLPTVFCSAPVPSPACADTRIIRRCH